MSCICISMTKALKIILFITLVSFVLGCKQKDNKLVNLEYTNGEEQITIQIDGERDYLIYDKPIATDFIVKNIKPNDLVIFGPGIKILGTNKDKTAMRTIIQVPSDYLETDTLVIKVKFGEGYKKGHDFLVPVKKYE